MLDLKGRLLQGALDAGAELVEGAAEVIPDMLETKAEVVEEGCVSQKIIFIFPPAELRLDLGRDCQGHRRAWDRS